MLPFTILTEAIAQVGAILILAKPENREKLIYFMGIDRVRFHAPVHPGDVVEIEVLAGRMRSRMGTLRGIARVNGKIVVEGKMTFALGPPSEAAATPPRGHEPVSSGFEQHPSEPAVVAGELALALVLGDGPPHLVELRVEFVGRREDERLDGHRRHRRSELVRPVVRRDEVLDERARAHRQAGEPGRGLAHQHQPERDVAHQVALERVAAHARVVDLVELADVVQQRAGEHEIGVGLVDARELVGHPRHLQDVLQQAAAVRVVDGLRSRPDAQPLAVVGHDAPQERLDAGDRRRRRCGCSSSCHISSTLRGDTGRQSSSRKPCSASPANDPADSRDEQLDAALVDAGRVPRSCTKSSCVEPVPELLDVVEDRRRGSRRCDRAA